MIDAVVEAESQSKAKELVDDYMGYFNTVRKPELNRQAKEREEEDMNRKKARRVSNIVRMEVDRVVGKGVRVCIKGKPKTEELIPEEKLGKETMRSAYAYTEKHIGPRLKVGNKGGTLYLKIKAVI